MTEKIREEESTIDRAPKIGTLRILFRVLEPISPALASRAAGALFRHPPRRRPSEWERRLLKTGQRRLLRTSSGRLATWFWGRGPRVLLVHGWGSRAARLGSFVEPIVASGFSAVAFDAPGHGASSGRLSSLPQFVEAIGTVRQEYGRIQAAVAHSMGSAAVALAMVRGGLSVACAVFVAPAANPGAYSRRFAQMLGISPQVRQGMEHRFEVQFGFRWEEFDLPRMVGSLTTPLLVFHDREDGEVPSSDGESIAGTWPGARLVLTRGLGHKRIVHDPGVVSESVAFLRAAEQNRMKALP